MTSPEGKAHSKRRRWLILAAAALFIAPVFLPTPLFWRLTRPVTHKHIIDRHAKEFGFDPLFVVALVRVESGFSASARSHRGAIGLMQIMPETAKEMARRLGLDPAKLVLDDPELNIRLGLKYLDVLRQEFGEDRVSILAAYNAGPRHVRQWREGKPLSVEKIRFRETQRFVRKVLSTEEWMLRLRRWKKAIHD